MSLIKPEPSLELYTVNLRCLFPSMLYYPIYASCSAYCECSPDHGWFDHSLFSKCVLAPSALMYMRVRGPWSWTRCTWRDDWMLYYPAECSDTTPGSDSNPSTSQTSKISQMRQNFLVMIIEPSFSPEHWLFTPSGSVQACRQGLFNQCYNLHFSAVIEIFIWSERVTATRRVTLK